MRPFLSSQVLSFLAGRKEERKGATLERWGRGGKVYPMKMKPGEECKFARGGKGAKRVEEEGELRRMFGSQDSYLLARRKEERERERGACLSLFPHFSTLGPK